MKTAFVDERTPARMLVARHMLAIAMANILIPTTPFRDQILEMFTEEEGTPQAELRRELAFWAKVSDQYLLDAVGDDIDLALELAQEDDPINGMSDAPPATLKTDDDFTKRYKVFRDYLFEQASRRVPGAVMATIH